MPIFDTDGGVLKVRPEGGFGGRVYAGYRFSNPYDIAIGLQGTDLSNGNGSGNLLTSPATDSQDAWYWAGDVEVGYNGSMNSVGYRVFIGARYVEWRHNAKGVNKNGDLFPWRVKDKFTGFGPRIGASGAARLAPGSAFSVFGDAAGSYIFGSRKQHSTIAINDSSGTSRSGQNSWNAEGQLGLAYEVAPNVNIAVGYRGEY